jgi:putative addiction module CopG family antidote
MGTAKVASGEYAHASEVVRDGVRLLMQEEANKLEWLRNAISEANASIAAGETFTPEQAEEELTKRRRTRLAAHRKRR